MKQKNRLNYVVFIAPTMVLFLLVFAVPVVVLVGSSFCNWRTGDPITFNGIGNYIELIFHDNSFRQGFLNNVVWILLQGTIHVAIGVRPDPCQKALLLEIRPHRLYDPQHHFQRRYGDAVLVYFQSGIRYD